MNCQKYYLMGCYDMKSGSSITSVNFFHTTWTNFLEDSTVNSHHGKNLELHKLVYWFSNTKVLTEPQGIRSLKNMFHEAWLD